MSHLSPMPCAVETATMDENAPSLGSTKLVGDIKRDAVQPRSQRASPEAKTSEERFAFEYIKITL